MLSDLIGSADDVEWVFVELVLVRVLAPLEIVGVHFVGGFDHRDADDDWGECFAVGYVDLHAGAGLAGEFGRTSGGSRLRGIRRRENRTFAARRPMRRRRCTALR